MIFHDIVEMCRNHPEILIFLSLAIGYYVGKIKFFGFSLGSTASVLLAALVLGQMNVAVTPLIKAVAFALFIFTIGYKVGPQFFGSLKKEGLNYIFLSIVVAITGLITAIILGKLFGFDKGTTAGLLSGAMTQSSVIGTAEGAIRNLTISSAQKSILESNVAVAYAITYIFGVAGLILFYKIVPRLLKINLKEEAQKLETKLSGKAVTPGNADTFTWNARPNLRAYQLTNHELEGKQISNLEDLFPGKVVVEKIKRNGQITDPAPDTILQVNDIIVIVGQRKQIIDAENIIGPEVDDPTLVNLPGEIIKICILKSAAEGKTLDHIIKNYGDGCFVKEITRQSHNLPLKAKTIIHKCDVLQVVGSQKDVENFAKNIGYPERKTAQTDLVMVGLGCFLGTLLGLAVIKIGTIPITLGTGASILLLGLIFGWLRSVHPTFGQIPDGAQWIFTNLGLNLFIACVGLKAGPRAIEALQTKGLALFFAGIALTLIPHIAGLIFGKLFLKLNPVLLLGALTGAGTATPSLNVLKNESESSTPALGYTVPYAFGNFILTIWGTVIVNFM